MKKLLIVVDFQNDFVNGSLGFPKAVFLERPICEKIDSYRRDGGDVLFTFDTHTKEYLSTSEGRKLPIEHCIRGTEGWNLYGEVGRKMQESDIRIEKVTFGSSGLMDYLRKNPYDVVELAGLVSNICVISNAVIAKAALPEAEIIVDADCTSCFDEEMNQKALDVMEGLQITILR